MDPKHELKLYQKEAQTKPEKDNTLNMYILQQNYGTAQTIEKILPGSLQPEKESGSFWDAFDYDTYLPYATGAEKEYAKKHPIKSRAEFVVSRLMLPDVVTKSKDMFPSIEKDYADLPAVMAGGLLAADTALSILPGVIKLPFKLAGKGFSVITNTGLKVGRHALSETLQAAARAESIPLISKPSQRLIERWKRPVYANIQSDSLDAMVHQLNRKNILFRSFDPTLPGTKKMTQKEMLTHAYKEVVRTNEHLQKYGLQQHPNHVFKQQMTRFFGPKGKYLDLGTASSQAIKNALVDLTKSSEQVALGSLMSNLSWVRPVRKVMGLGEQLGLKTYTKGYLELNSHFTAANELQFRMIERFQNMAHANGLGEIIPKKRKANVFKLHMTKHELDAAGKGLHQLDEWTQAGASPKQLQEAFDQLPIKSQAMIKTYRAWADEAYFLHFWVQVDDLLHGMTMSQKAMANIQRAVDKSKANMQHVMDARTNVFDGLKRDAIEDELSTLRSAINSQSSRLMYPNMHPADALRAKRKLISQLQFESQVKVNSAAISPVGLKLIQKMQQGPGRITNYLDNYAQKVGKAQEERFAKFLDGLIGVKRAGYMAHRDLELINQHTFDIRTMVETRAYTQAREIELRKFLHPNGEFARWAGSLPQGYREYVEHYVARMLGRPSMTDIKMAHMMMGTRTGKVLAKLVGHDEMSGATLDKIAQEICNFCYMGTLGLKPGTAIRNLFQHPLLAGTEVMSNRYMARGVKMLQDERVVKELYEMGVVKEYAPELFAEIRAWANTGLVKAFGKEYRPTLEWDAFRDALLQMFAWSDEQTRLMTGATAMSVWDDAAAAVGKDFGSAGKLLSKQDKNTFFKAIRIKNRDPHVRKQIGKLLDEHDYKAARSLYINDMVADINFLYGKTDSPLGFYKMGATGKMASVFQSWMINYAELAVKWYKTGDVDQKMATWLAANSGAFLVMSAMWGTHIAAGNTFTAMAPMAPVVFTPVTATLDAIMQGVTGDWEGAKKEFGTIPNSMAKIFIPAASELSMVSKAASEGGALRALPAIAGFHTGKAYEALGGP